MNRFLIFAWALLSAFVIHAAPIGNPSFADFNTNQFSTTGRKVALLNGAVVTNITVNTISITNLTLNNIVYGFPITNFTSGQFLSVITNGTNVYVVGTNLPTTTVVFDTLEELTVTPVPTPGISLFGIVRDSRGGVFVFQPNSVAVTNDFRIYPTPGTGRWLRLSDGDDIRLEWGTVTGGLVTNATLVAALTLQSAQGYGRVVFNGAVEFSTNAVPLLDNNVLFFEDGAQATGLKLTASGKTNIAIYGGLFVAAVSAPTVPAISVTNSSQLVFQGLEFRGYSVVPFANGGGNIDFSAFDNADKLNTPEAFGAVINDGLDDSPAVNFACAIAREGSNKRVVFRGGTYNLATKINAKNCELIGDGSTILFSTVASDSAVEAIGDASIYTFLPVGVVRGATNFFMASPPALVRGDLVRIISTNDFSTDAGRLQGEIVQVYSVSGTNVVILGNFEDDYSVAHLAKVSKITPATFKLDGITIRQTYADLAQGLKLQYCINPSVNGRFINCKYTSVYVADCWAPVIDIISEGNDQDENGYGVLIGNATMDARVYGYSYGARHAVALSGDSEGGVPWRAQVINFTGVHTPLINENSAVFDSHPAVGSVSYINCTAIGNGATPAFGLYGRYNYVVNCQAQFVGSGVVYSSSLVKISDMHIDGLTINRGRNTSSSYGVWINAGTVTNLSVVNLTTDQATAAVRIGGTVKNLAPFRNIKSAGGIFSSDAVATLPALLEIYDSAGTFAAGQDNYRTVLLQDTSITDVRLNRVCGKNQLYFLQSDQPRTSVDVINCISETPNNSHLILAGATNLRIVGSTFGNPNSDGRFVVATSALITWCTLLGNTITGTNLDAINSGSFTTVFQGANDTAVAWGGTVASYALGGSPNSVMDLSGPGSPEGRDVALPGSTFRQTDGASGQNLWTKTGSGNTGWVLAGSVSGWIDDGTVIRLLAGTDKLSIGETTNTISKVNIVVDESAELNGLSLVNNRLEGYGTAIRFFSTQKDNTNRFEAARLQIQGYDTWTNTAARSSFAHLDTVNAGILGEAMRWNANGVVNAKTDLTSGGIISGSSAVFTNAVTAGGSISAGTSVSGSTGAFTNGATAPIIYGGSSTSQDLNFQTTTGVGAAGADMHFQVGNNGATVAITVLNNGNVGIGQTGPVAPLHIGDSTVNNSSDGMVLISRNVNDTGAGLGAAGHAFSDSSTITRGGVIGYNSFDGRVIFSGSSNYNHYAAFQSAATYSSSGTLGIMYGLVNVPAVSAGTITDMYGAYTADPTGAGSVVNNYGLYVPQLSKGSTKNYAVYADGTTRSYFGGVLNSSAGIMISTNDATTTPSKLLQIQTADGTEASFRLYQLGQNYWDIASRAGSTHFDIGDIGGTKFSIVSGSGNVGIGDTSPAALFTVGDGDKFQIDANGNIVKLRNVTTSFPSTNATEGQILASTAAGAFYFTNATAAGATINATDGAMPYRANATTFSDSPIARLSSSAVTVASLATIGAASSQGYFEGQNSGDALQPTFSFGSQDGYYHIANTHVWLEDGIQIARLIYNNSPFTGAGALSLGAGAIYFGGSPLNFTNSISSGYGTPEGTLAQPAGSFYLDRTTSAGKAFVKSTGVGNTGWGTIPLLESAQTWTGINTFTNATNPALFLGAGVGIGTNATPSSKLTIRSSGDGLNNFESKNVTGETTVGIDGNGHIQLTSPFYISFGGSQYLKSGGTSKFNFLGSSFADASGIILAGQIGIGLTSPAAGTLLDVAGIISADAGLSTSNYRAGGTIKVDSTTTGNFGGGEDNLISYSVPASTLGTDKDYLEFDVWGTFAANVNTKQIKIYFGATVLLDTTSLIFNGVDWRGHGKIVRKGAATQTVTCEFTVGGTLLSAVNSTITKVTAPTETLSGAVTFKVTGTDTGGVPADNAVIQEGMVLQWKPGN